jgi:hypothetical protein
MARTARVASHILISYGRAVCQVCGAKKDSHAVTARWLSTHRHGSVKFITQPVLRAKDRTVKTDG